MPDVCFDCSSHAHHRRGGTDKETHYDCPVRSDVFATAAEHVVYDEIVVPGFFFYDLSRPFVFSRCDRGLQPLVSHCIGALEA